MLPQEHQDPCNTPIASEREILVISNHWAASSGRHESLSGGGGEKGGEVKWHSGQAAGSCRTVVDMLLVGRHVDGLIVFGDAF